jgi:hypothetical protein
MPKVAVCFYGFLRCWDGMFPLWKRLFDKYDADVFIQTWDTETYKAQELGTPYEWQTKPLDVDAVTGLYKPKAIAVEIYKNMYPELLKKCQWVYDERERFIASNHPDAVNIDTNRIISNYSMWYTWNKVSKLKNSYGKYDVVLLIRSDFLVTDPFDFSNVTQIHTPPWPDGVVENWTKYDEGINDHWIYGPNKDMDVLCDLYNNAENLWDYLMVNYNFERVVNPHKMPAFQMKVNGISYVKTSNHGNIIGKTW